jgi:FkbM family methyltransferase
MPLDPSSARSVSLPRCAGKFLLFLLKGHGPGLAWWLARRDAAKRYDYRGVPRPALTAAWQADPTWADLTVHRGRVSSTALGLEFLGDDPASRGYPTWRALAQLGWQFAREGSDLIARRGPLALTLVTEEEEEMIKEIFLRNCYDLRLPGRWQVVDIGANVGMAALFFAQQPWIERIFSYEPFAATAEGFALNVGRNPLLTQKIQLFRVALGETAGQLSVDYNPALRGSMSLAGVGAWRGEAGPAVEKMTVSVEQASLALKPVFQGLGDCRLLAKVDCEGSEYGILRNLEATGALANFSAFVIEWHGQGPDELVQILARHGFALQVHPLSTNPRDLGLIYATRLSPPVKH